MERAQPELLRGEKNIVRALVIVWTPRGEIKIRHRPAWGQGPRSLKQPAAPEILWASTSGVRLLFNAFPTPDAAKVWILSRNSWYTAGTYRKPSRNGRMRTYLNTLSIHRISENFPHPIHYPHSRIVVSTHDAHSYSSLTHSNRIPTPRTRGYRRISTAHLTCVTSSLLRPKRGGSATEWKSLQCNMVTIT
jgi:hypothetical protein